MMTLFVAIFFALLSAACVLTVLWVFAKSIPVEWYSLPSRFALNRRMRALNQADLLKRQGNVKAAAKILRAAMLFEAPARSSMIDSIHNHNLSVLSRLVSLNDEGISHFTNLPIIEGLIQTRADLLRNIAELRDQRKALKSRRKQNNRNTPAWALNEFERRESELLDRLKTNHRSLDSQLDILMNELLQPQASSEITYH